MFVQQCVAYANYYSMCNNIAAAIYFLRSALKITEQQPFFPNESLRIRLQAQVLTLILLHLVPWLHWAFFFVYNLLLLGLPRPVCH